MKIFAFAAGIALALGSIASSVPSAEAQRPGYGENHGRPGVSHRNNRARDNHRGDRRWNNGRNDRRWNKHRRSCRTVWRNHRRVQVCR